jgi:hypothetical protein
MAGSIVSSAVPKMAAIWLRMKVEISRPMAVAARHRAARPGQRQKLPFSGTPNSVTASSRQHQEVQHRQRDVGSCLPSRNSMRVTGVT